MMLVCVSPTIAPRRGGGRCRENSGMAGKDRRKFQHPDTVGVDSSIQLIEVMYADQVPK
jgi:hypothetical protein